MATLSPNPLNVINIHQAPDGWQTDSQYVYIGRWNKYYNMQKSIWHNPIKLVNDTIVDREYCLIEYTRYLMSNMRLLSQLDKLIGKTLVCWCHPKLCHGHVLSIMCNRDVWSDSPYNVNKSFSTRMFNPSDVHSMDEIGSCIAHAVNAIRIAYADYEQWVEDYPSAIAYEKAMNDEYSKVKHNSNGYDEIRTRLKARKAYELAHEARLKIGGNIIGANATLNRMNHWIFNELLQWKEHYNRFNTEVKSA